MKKQKKFLALILSCFMIISALPLTAGAAEEVIYWMGGGIKHDTLGNAPGCVDIPPKVVLANGTIGTTKNMGNDYGWLLELSNNDHQVQFEIVPTYTGIYKLEIVSSSNNKDECITLLVDGVEKTSLKVKTKSITTYTPRTAIANIMMTAGETTVLAFTNSTTDGYAGAVGLRDCYLTYIAPPELDESSIEEGDTVGRSTDVITLDYSRELVEDKLDDAVVTIEDSLSNELKYSLELDDADASKVNIILSESLKYGESYTLTHTAFTDSVGYSTEEVTVNFVTAPEADDNSADNSTVDIDADVENTSFTVTGTVYGSKGQGIAGRNVTISMTSPLGNDTKVIGTVPSDDNGAFTLTYTLSEDEEENGGLYSFSAAAEHAAIPSEDDARYISEGQKQALLGTLEGCTSAGEAEAFFAAGTNAADLGADMSSLSELTDVSLFYDRLAKASYKDDNGEYNLKVFERVWNISYALEMINQKGIVSYLDDADFAAEIGLDTHKYSALITQKDAFLTAVKEIPRQETAEAFGKAVNELINEYLLKENDKTDLSLTLSDASVYVGQTAKVDLNLSTKSSDVSEYTVEVTCPSGGVAEDVKLEGPSGTTVNKTKSGNVASFKVTNVVGELTKLGTLKYSSSSERTEELTVSGTAVYDIDGILLECDITEADVDIEVKKNTSSGGSGKNSNYSSAGGGNKVSVAPVIDPDEGKQEVTLPSGKVFNDISDAHWAEESIISLYNLGIISEAADGRFRPDDSVTRAEFVKMLTVALSITDKSVPVNLADVSQNDWYYPYVSAAVNYGLVLGDEHGNFNPNAKITRQDICVIVSRAMDKLGYGDIAGDGTLFIDDYMISDYAKGAVYRMRTHEIVNGTGDGSFAPLSVATRAATAKIIDTFMKEAKI